jgi:hypothetical protein
MQDDERMTYVPIELPSGEVVDFASPAVTPEALRRAAAHLKARAQHPPNWYKPPEPERVEPPQRGFADLMYRRVDDPFTEADAKAFRRANALAQIRTALREEERQAAEQAEKALADRRQQIQQAAGDLGRLLLNTRRI